MLVVNAVIGILAALLLPALGRAKAVAKRVHCANNIRQLALTVHLYADDNKDRLPRYNWDWLFRDGYLNGDTNVFQCVGNSHLQSASSHSIFQSKIIGGGVHLLFGNFGSVSSQFNFAYNFE